MRFILKTEFHSLMLQVYDISKHAATQQKTMLRLTHPVVEERLEDKHESAGKDSSVSVGNKKSLVLPGA